MAPSKSQKCFTTKQKPTSKKRGPLKAITHTSTPTMSALSRCVTVNSDEPTSVHQMLSSDVDFIMGQLESEIKRSVCAVSNSEAMDVEDSEMELSAYDFPVL